jgi:hypothetical protein
VRKSIDAGERRYKKAKIHDLDDEKSEVRKSIDAGERRYKKAKIHDLDDEKSLIPPDFFSTCSVMKALCDQKDIMKVFHLISRPTL